jgi:hypothetical protein
MYRIRETMVIELMQGSLNSSMGEHLVATNKLASSGHQTLPITPDGIPSGAPAVREALSDPELRVLRGSIFYPCNPPARHASEAGGCVPRSGTCAEKLKSLRAPW